MQMHQPGTFPFAPASGENAAVASTLDLWADLLYTRWKRAVDILWRETVRRRRQAAWAERERARAARRVRNLQRIVRKALSDYHKIEIERQNAAQSRAANKR